MTSKEYLELAIIEFEKEQYDDPNNEWLKSVIKGMKECKQDLERLEKLEKIIRDYCYIDNFNDGEIIRMCCEENEESNTKDFVFLKGVLEK